METNHCFKLVERPLGLPQKNNWKLEEASLPQIGKEQVLLQIVYISIDPAMRGWMDNARSYIPPVRIGDVMRALTLSKVIASEHPDFQIGDYVTGSQGVQSYALSNGKDLTKIDPTVAPLPKFLGPLGMTGMTAYFGLLEVGKPQAGENVLVSAAAGAVGQIVGQIAKIKGCNVAGIAGGAEKCAFIKEELGFDNAIDYKSQSVEREIKRCFQKGLDIYFDNVGGEILEAALFNLNRRARIVICGAISQYNNREAVTGPANYLSLLINRARMEGMVVFDYADRYNEAAKEIAGWMASGQLKSKEEILKGIEIFPEALLNLFSGKNVGKLILQVSEP